MSQNHVTKTRLRNGLTVILRTVHTVPIVSFWVWYRVGSRHEHTGRTGSSHWVEHMQFKEKYIQFLFVFIIQSK